jgi:hypothetical protein
MEPEQPPLYIYNPHVLAVLHSKTQCLGLLREYHAVHDDGDGEARLLIRDNLYDCVLVADVTQLARALADDEFPLDLYLAANYEYALYRLLLLCQPPNEVLPVQCCTMELGSPFVCDLKCQVLLERDPRDSARFRAALQRYLTLQYFTATTLRDYERVSRGRATMLMQVKRSAERAEAVRRAPDYDYAVRYTKELHQTMAYLCLLNELLAMDDREQPLLLLQLMYDALRQHYESEFRDSAVSTAPRGGDAEEDAHFGRYTRTGCVWEQVREVRSTQHGFTVPTRDARNLRYLDLRRNASCYQYAVRRFTLDLELQRLHAHYCPRLGSPPKQKGGALPCHTCAYMERRGDESLQQFYELCERYAYHAPDYSGANETRLHDYLGQAILPLVPRLDAILYKNLWQLQRLFALEPPLQLAIPTERALPLQVGVRCLFQALDLVALLHDVALQYDEAEGGLEARIETLLAQQRPRFSLAPSTMAPKWQMRLAIDSDAVLCILRALGTQQSAVEKCERALTAGAQHPVTPRHDSLESQRQFFAALRSAVTRAYMLYLQELHDALS